MGGGRIGDAFDTSQRDLPYIEVALRFLLSPGSMFLISCARNRPGASFIHDSVRTVYDCIALRLSQFSERLHAV